MKKNIALAAASVLTAGFAAQIVVGDVSPLSATGPSRRMSASYNDVGTGLVSSPTVQKRILSTNIWSTVVSESSTANLVKQTNDLQRPFIPAMLALTALDCNNNGVNDSTEIANGAPDIDGDGTLDSCEYKWGDLNLNGVIDQQDVSILMGWWGITNPLFGDLTGDNVVNAYDLGTILGRFGIVSY